MFAKHMLRQLFSLAGDFPFKVIYWDHTDDTFGKGEPCFTITVHDEHILSEPYDDYEIALADAYVDGKWDIDGDLGDIISLASATLARLEAKPGADFARLFARMSCSMGRRSLKAQKSHVQRHYDLGNNFYKLWLDSSLTYSCAYFRHLGDSLETAQLQKIDHSLNKLRLKPGESLLDIGCGWQALCRRAVTNYQARAMGITLSQEQYDFGYDTLHAQGLEDRCDVRLIDYQNLALTGRKFDKIASIGMIEHVGKAHLADFSRSLATLLKPGGLALLHFITTPKEGPFCAWMDKNIFPGAYLPTLAETIGHFTDHNLRILDVENLRKHYQLTLDQWSERFEEKTDVIADMFDDRFVRMWRVYLRCCSASFREGIVELHQVLVSNGNSDILPLTRDDLYVA